MNNLQLISTCISEYCLFIQGLYLQRVWFKSNTTKYDLIKITVPYNLSLTNMTKYRAKFHISCKA